MHICINKCIIKIIIIIKKEEETEEDAHEY